MSYFCSASRSPCSRAYTDKANPEDPNEISFDKNEVMEILDKQGKWWQAKKVDGTVGSKYSNLSVV